MQVLDTGRIPIVAFATPDGHNCRVSRVRVSQLMNSRLLKAGLQFATVVLLLFAVAGLSTLAKNSQYFPKSNPAHYVNASNKMKAAPSADVLERAPLYPIAKVVLPQPCAPRNHGVEEISLPSPSIGVTVSIQHRSPPPSQS
jgi:hypothetical protein